MTPETATPKLGTDVYNIRAELSTYHGELHNNMGELDTSCGDGVTALQVIATDAATELGSSRGNTNESNTKIATKFAGVEQALGGVRGMAIAPQQQSP
jgi:hypothetical protein